MLPKLEYYPVNWVDGMKISRKHFTDFEHFVSDQLRDSVAVNVTSYSYGLLPSDAPDFALQVITDQNQNLRLQLTNCRAVTGAGCRIELINEQIELATSLTEVLAKYNIPMADELHFLVVLSIDLFVRKPAGAPSNSEPFPRPPYTLPTYWLSVVPAHQYDAQSGNRPGYPSATFESTHLIVGQVTCRHGQLTNVDSYIPACAAVSAHSALLAWSNQLGKMLAEVQRDAFIIVEKVVKKRGTQQGREAGPLAELIRTLAEQVALSLDDVLNHLHFNGREASPMELLQRVTLATRTLKTTLVQLNDRDLVGSLKLGKDLVLPYFQSWTDISPVQIESALEAVITRPYQHDNIRPHLDLITRCWGQVQVIFKVMTEREYIGQKPNRNGVLDISRPTDERDLPREPAVSVVPKAAPSFRFTGGQ